MPAPRGRPREHDREKIAQDMIEWAKKEDSLNLNKFCALYDPPIAPSKITEWARQEEYFRLAYETAKAFLGFRREEKLNNEELHVKAYDLNAAVYDHFLKEEKREQAKFELALKNQTDSNIEPKILENFDRTMKQLRELQSSALSMEDKSISNEQKS